MVSPPQNGNASDSATGDPKQFVRKSAEQIDFAVEEIENVCLVGPDALMARELMSPFVWMEPDGKLGIMVRAVPSHGEPVSDTGMIWAGWSDDGVTFTMLDVPSIVPGPEERDIGGVEDPTVVRLDDGRYVIYYSGVAANMASCALFYATGPSLGALVKQGVALASSKSMGSIKEAAVYRSADGHWRLFYEYAADDASRIGLAIGEDDSGPWIEQPTPFVPRPDGWDSWHLSTGPLLTDEPDMPVMFYNGATRDARWRIGWVAFDRDMRAVTDRCIQPLITPPPGTDRTDTDIAFASSVIVREKAIWLYYSREDRRLSRARLKRFRDVAKVC